MQDDHASFFLGDILVSPPHNQLSLGERTLSLQPKVMAVLCYLAQHSERVVSNDELLDQVWQGRVVTHASVQKSMNTLRNALAELGGDREFVAHFSKRGYQLVVPVRFVASDDAAVGTSLKTKRDPGSKQRLTLLWVLPALVVLLGALVWLSQGNRGGELHTKSLAKHHLTAFTAVVPLSGGGDRERRAELHPDGKRKAYIRDLITQDGLQSQIFIAGTDGTDWLLAAVEGTWVDLAWSPSGRNLVATEIRRAEGLPSTLDYFEKPNNLYTFHIFTLDFRGERLLEKNLLSQWQGVVASVTWWDENTLEFVASLGPGSQNERYRYLITEQQLSTLNPLESGFMPLYSAVHNKLTAVVSRRRSVVRLDFLDAEQNTIRTVPLSSATLDFSWIPDGTGLLILDKTSSAFYTLDLYGEVSPLQFPAGDLRSFSHPRYGEDGQSIVLTIAKEHPDLSLIGINGGHENIGANIGAPRLSLFVPTDGGVVFSAENHGKHSLWRWRNGSEMMLQALETPVEAMVLAADGGAVIYRSGGTVWQLDPRDRQPLALWKKAGFVEPIFYDPDTRDMLFVRRSGDARNIWQRNLNGDNERQMTFGSVGTVITADRRLYFQYSDQPGLWRLDSGNANPVQISRRLPKNSKLLYVSATSAFFVTGGPCRESSLQSLDLLTDTLSVVMVRESEHTVSQDFHPSFGILQSDCKPADSQIIQFINTGNF